MSCLISSAVLFSPSFYGTESNYVHGPYNVLCFAFYLVLIWENLNVPLYWDWLVWLPFATSKRDFFPFEVGVKTICWLMAITSHVWVNFSCDVQPAKTQKIVYYHLVKFRNLEIILPNFPFCAQCFCFCLHLYINILSWFEE